MMLQPDTVLHAVGGDREARVAADHLLREQLASDPVAFFTEAFHIALRPDEAAPGYDPTHVAPAAASVAKNLALEAARSGSLDPQAFGAAAPPLFHALLATEVDPAMPFGPVITPLAIAAGTLAAVAHHREVLPPDANILESLVGHLRTCFPLEGDIGIDRRQQDVVALALTHHLLKAGSIRRRLSHRFDGVYEEFAAVLEPTAMRLSELWVSGQQRQELKTYRCAVLSAKALFRCVAVGRFDPSRIERCAAMAESLAARVAGEGEEDGEMATITCRFAKIITKGVTANASRLHEFDAAFLGVILPFLCNATTSTVGVLPRKYVSRALLALQSVLVAVDSSEFLQQAIPAFFADAGVVRQLVTNLVKNFLCDEELTPEMWSEEPELCVPDVERDYDADDEGHCAEEVLLALMEAGGEHVALPTWELLGSLLDSEASSDRVGALHAIGTAYATLRDHGDFVGFLSGTLLPMLHHTSSGREQADPKLLRRAVWAIGMWCESIDDPAGRAAVHAALQHVITTSPDPVLILTAIRATENYVSDNNFDPAELGQRFGDVLQVIGSALPQLHEADSVKLVAQLLGVLLEKGAGSAVGITGNAIVDAFAPPLQAMVHTAETSAANGVETEHNIGTCVAELLRVLAVAVATAEDAEAAWSALLSPAQAITDPEHPLTLSADSEAWDVLQGLAQCLPSSALSEPLADASFALFVRSARSVDRDFEALPKAVRTAAVLLLAFRAANLPRLTEAAALASNAVSHSLPILNIDDGLAALYCLGETALLADHQSVCGELFRCALAVVGQEVAARQREVEEADAAQKQPHGLLRRPAKFNAAAALLGRMMQLAPSLWVDSESLGLVNPFIEELVEGYGDMFDVYQRRIAVSGAVLMCQEPSVAQAVTEDSVGYVRQMVESEALPQPEDVNGETDEPLGPPEQYLRMWHGFAEPSELGPRHRRRLREVVLSDPFATGPALP